MADKLTELFGGQRATYEGYWDDIAPFIKSGCMKDQKFFDSVKKVLLLKTTAGDYLTFEEYKTRNEAKAAKKVFYTNDAKRQAASVALYTERGIDVAVMDSLIDVNFMSFMEYAGGEDSVTFARVDADVSGLTEDSDEGKDLNAEKIREAVPQGAGQGRPEREAGSAGKSGHDRHGNGGRAEPPLQGNEPPVRSSRSPMPDQLHAGAEPPQQSDSGTGGTRPGERDDAAALPANLRFGAYERPAAGSGRGYRRS